MKYEKIKKQSMIEGGIVVAVLAVLGAIVYLISTIDDDYDAGNDALKKQVEAIDAETNVLKSKYSNIQKNIDIYNEMRKKQEDGRLAINRQMVLEKFNQFKNQYVLSGMHLTVSPAQDIKDPLFKRKTSSVNFSDVTVTFESTTDEGIYQLIDSLRDELPGISKLTKLSLTLQKPLNKEALIAIAQKGSFPLVKGEIQFKWYGLNAVETPEVKPADNPMLKGPPHVPQQ